MILTNKFMYRSIIISIITTVVASAYGGEDAPNFSMPLEEDIVTFPIKIAYVSNTKTRHIILQCDRDTTPWQVHKRITEILHDQGSLVLHANNNKSKHVNGLKETTILALLEKNENAELRFITS